MSWFHARCDHVRRQVAVLAAIGGAIGCTQSGAAALDDLAPL